MHWVPATIVEDQEDMWTETNPEVLWKQQVDDHIWKNNGQPACLCQEEWDELFSNTCENVTAHVRFCQSEFTGLTPTRMTRGDELLRRMIPESGWRRFLQATVAEWGAILDTSAVTIISPAASKDTRKHLSHRTVPSRHVYREKPGEGVGAASKPSVGGVFSVIVIQTYGSLNDLLQHHKRPQFTHSCLLQQSSNVK